MTHKLLILMTALVLACCGEQRTKKANEDIAGTQTETQTSTQTEATSELISAENATENEESATDDSELQPMSAEVLEKIDLSEYKKYGIVGISQGYAFTIEADEKLNLDGLDVNDASLNDLRFHNWSDKEWLNNNYIRSVRLYLDAYCMGAFQNNEYDKFKSVLKGKFVIAYIEPYIIGGADMALVMVDNPRFVVRAWVYSCVVDNSIISYDVRSFEVEVLEEPITTKKEIMQNVSENPNYNIW